MLTTNVKPVDLGPYLRVVID